jgi:hypothetical protein
VTVQEALKAFSEIQRLAVQDNRDPERFLASRDGTAVAAAATGTGGAAPATRSLANGRSARSASSSTPGQHVVPSAVGKSSSGGATDADTSQLKKRLELAETVIKKLHDKNRALQAEVNSLKKSQMSDAGAGVAASRPPTGAAAEAPRPTTADQASLQLRVREQEAAIAALRAQLQQVQATAAAAGAAAAAAPTSSPAGGAATSVSDTTAAAELRLVREQLAQSRKQYDALATVNLDCVREGEATGKVNKEVKAFFVTTRQKMLEDSAAQEAERALLHGRIAELEVQLAQARSQ